MAGTFNCTNMKKENLVAEIEISYKPTQIEMPVIRSAEDIHELVSNFFKEDTVNLIEQFVVCYLNRKGKLLGVYQHSKGGITETTVDVRIIFAIALKIVATGIILAHNHPSGNLKHSHQDILLTQRIETIAELFDITLIDHIVVNGENQFSSYRNNVCL